MAMLRVFTAVKIPQPEVRRIDSALRRWDLPQLRRVTPDQMHLTLNFIGDVEDRKVGELCSALSQAIEENLPFEVCLNGLGAFPAMDRARVLWIGVEQGTDQLVDLNRRLSAVIEEFGFVQEKRYKPHLTIARTKKGGVPGATLVDMEKDFARIQHDPFPVQNVVVFNSILEREGPTYVPLATLALNGG